MKLRDEPIPAWAVTPEKVEAAVTRLIEAARPRKVFLFGSHVRGLPHQDSDLDILVVTDDSVTESRRESVRLRRVLRGILMPMDIVCVRESFFNAHCDTPGLIYQEVIERGELVYDAAT